MPQPHQAGVLPAGPELIAIAEAHKLFKVRRHAGMVALNYAYITDDKDQFEWPRSEMRGLIVDEATGEVIAPGPPRSSGTSARRAPQAPTGTSPTSS